MNLLVTGGAGFIGSHFIRLILAETEYSIINLDALTYAGKIENTADFASNPRYRFVKGSITDRALVFKLAEKVDAIVNFAAESHVDNSILNPSIFVETNILGTQTLLDVARKFGVKKFVQVSTDEVYGDLPLPDKVGLRQAGTDFDATEKFHEHSPLRPSSPYSASKTGADLLALAAHRTFGLDVSISRCSNNFGTHQLSEKLIPLTVKRALAGEKIPVYGDGKNVRDWIHVLDHCRAVLQILENGKPGEIYNVGADNERANIDVVKLILQILGRSENLIEFVTDRLGHDRRYAIDSRKIQRELDWTPRETNFETALAEVINWYQHRV